MSFPSKLTLYDFLCMFVTGVLFLLVFMPEEVFDIAPNCKCRKSNFAFIVPFIYSFCAFIIGLVWHKLMEWLLNSKTIECLSRYYINVLKSFHRCDDYLLQCTKKTVLLELSEMPILNESPNNIRTEYYKAYYKLMTQNALGSVPVLEAQLAFVRDIIFPLFVNGILLVCGKWDLLQCWQIPWIGICTICFSVIVLPMVHYALQKKIYELIWIGDICIQDGMKSVEH